MAPFHGWHNEAHAPECQTVPHAVLELLPQQPRLSCLKGGIVFPLKRWPSPKPSYPPRLLPAHVLLFHSDTNLLILPSDIPPTHPVLSILVPLDISSSGCFLRKSPLGLFPLLRPVCYHSEINLLQK